jgi:hypothetical protein
MAQDAGLRTQSLMNGSDDASVLGCAKLQSSVDFGKPEARTLELEKPHVAVKLSAP